MATTPHPLVDPRRFTTVRRIVTLFLFLGCGAAVAIVPANGAPSTLLFLPVIAAATLMLCGPLRRPWVRRPIATMPTSDGPMPCADCAYAIHAPASATCPECGGRDVERSPSRHWRWFGHAGELSILLVTVVPTAFLVFRSINLEGGDWHHSLLFSAILFGLALIGPPAIVLQLGTLGRLVRWWLPGVMVLLAVSVAASDWPAAAVWSAHRVRAEALHARVAAGETISLPVRLAGREVVRIQRFPDGTTAYLVDASSDGFYRMPTTMLQRPGSNWWSGTRLSPLWRFRVH